MLSIWLKWYGPPFPWERSKQKPQYLVLHHTGGPPNQPIENIKSFHEKDRGWPHIGYHYVASPLVLYKTLPLSAVPICVRKYNLESICLAITGDWSKGVPSAWRTLEAAAVMREIAQVVKHIQKAYPRIKLVRHKDLVQTECPGMLTWHMVLNWDKEVL